MSGYSTNIETRTLENQYFRHVLFTGPNLQLVVMTLQPGEDIGVETHDDHDQFFRVEEGVGVAMIDNERHELSDGMVAIIPAGAEHNVINTSDNAPLRIYTIYAPAEHPDGTINKTRADAVAYDEARHG